MSALDDIYSAISHLESANRLLKDECRPNSNRYESCKHTDHVITRAKEAYRKLCDEKRTGR